MYTHHKKGTRYLAAQEEEDLILSWVELHVSALSAIHIPNMENSQVLSCQRLTSGEWAVHPEVFEKLCRRWGTLNVHLLASKFNVKLDRFICRIRDHRAEVDALVVSWDQFFIMHTFPSLQYLPHLLCRIPVEGNLAILITPAWPWRTWYSNIVNLSVDKPWTLPDWSNLLSQGPIFHPAFPLLVLTAWLLKLGS